MEKRYETVIIFDSNLSEADIATQLERIEAIIQSHSGAIYKKDIWGRRELAYKIAKRDYGMYVVLVFSGDNSVVVDLRRQLKINEAVIRFLIVDKDDYAPDFVRHSHSENTPAFRDDRGGSDFAGEGEEAPV